MKRIKLVCFICVCLIKISLGQNAVSKTDQNASLFVFDTLSQVDSTKFDSILPSYHFAKKYTLIDTIRNDSLLIVVFKPYLSIKNSFSEKSFVKIKRSLPTIKEIKFRVIDENTWKFWVLISIILYISFIRIINSNNFNVFILSVFNLKLSEKIWDEQRSFFGFVILQLFAIYIFIAAIFITNWLQLKHIRLLENDVNLFLVIILVLLVTYILKFALHAFLGYLLEMKKLGIGMVSNTVSVNNFISLVLLPFIIFLIYNDNPIVKTILSEAIIATFFLSIIYRVLRITLLSNSFFSFPKIYLFIYLCALEILPWFVIIKYLNWFQI